MKSTLEKIKFRYERSKFLQNFFSFDGFILLTLPILAAIITTYLSTSFFGSILLFLGLPSLYLSLRTPRYIVKCLIFSTISSIPLIIVIDYIGQLSLSWAFPPSIFAVEILGVVSIEVLLWALFNIYAAVIFYEFFEDNHERPVYWRPKMKVLVKYISVWVGLFVAIFLITDGSIAIPYFYLLFGSVLFLYPIFMHALYYPSVLKKLFWVGLYFSYLSLLYEIIALKESWWWFPGDQFIGYVKIAGESFPLEELIFWIMLFAPAVVGAFEYLDDDNE